jgi:hypothetical protein
MTRNRISGIIGTVWGAGIILSRLAGCNPQAQNQSYATGQNAALVFGVLLLIAGLYYLTKK